MSLFDANLIEIKLYYTFKKKGNSQILIVLDDEKAQKMLEDEKTATEVNTLVTQWSIMNWSEQNNSVRIAYNRINEMTGEKIFDHIGYRDSIIKSCLKAWDILIDGQPAHVTPEAIDSLPGDIVISLFDKYEKMLNYSEDELKN